MRLERFPQSRPQSEAGAAPTPTAANTSGHRRAAAWCVEFDGQGGEGVRVQATPVHREFSQPAFNMSRGPGAHLRSRGLLFRRTELREVWRRFDFSHQVRPAPGRRELRADFLNLALDDRAHLPAISGKVIERVSSLSVIIGGRNGAWTRASIHRCRQPAGRLRPRSKAAAPSHSRS